MTRRTTWPLATLAWLALAGSVAAQATPEEEPVPAESAESTEAAAPTAPPADAEPAPAHVREARARVARGEALFERGDFDAALVEFERAHEVIGEHPSRYLVLYNIGACHERRFRYHEALRYYRRYLSEGGSEDPDRSVVDHAIRTLDDLLATVTVRADHAPATVYLDDREVAEVPAEVRVAGGRHVIEVRAEGRIPDRQSLSVPAGGTVAVEARLAPVGELNEGLHPAFFLAGAGLTAAALGVGVGFGIAALLADNEAARNDSVVLRSMAPERYDEDYYAHAANLAIAADVFYVVSGALAVGSIVLAILTQWDEPEQSDSLVLRPRLEVTPTGGSLGLAGRL